MSFARLRKSPSGLLVITFRGKKAGLLPFRLFTFKMPTAGVFAVPFRELSQTNEGPFTMVLCVLELAPHMGIPHHPADPTPPPTPHP